jgi:hypothetical protein
LRLAAPVEAFERQLVVARAERGAVESNAQVAVGVLVEVVDDRDTSLVDAIDGDAE